MKVYLLKDNGMNQIVIEENGLCKCSNCAPDGLFDGVVDIYDDDITNVVLKLRDYINNTAINDYNDIWWDEYNFSEIEKATDDGEAELIYVTEVK